LDFISLEDLKKRNRLFCFIAVIGATQFLIVTIIAMFFYPGGYSFWTDHFSTLGLIYSYSSSTLPLIPNTISFILFVITLTIAGITFIPLWVILPSCFNEKKQLKILSWIASILGIISSIFFIGIGALPADVFPFEHVNAAVGFFSFITIAVFLFSLTIILNDKFSKNYAYIGLIVTVFGALYSSGLATGIFGGMFGVMDAILQKFTVYGFIIWIIILCIKVWQMVGPETNSID